MGYVDIGLMIAAAVFAARMAEFERAGAFVCVIAALGSYGLTSYVLNWSSMVCFLVACAVPFAGLTVRNMIRARRDPPSA